MVHRERTWIEISAGAVQQNLRSFQRLVGPAVGIMPIIKANAYGHGLWELHKILRTETAAAVGVAYGEEALCLRAMGHRGRIVVLSSWQADELPELLKQKIELVVWDWSSWRFLTTAARRLTIHPNVHVKLDTGTTRIGFLPTDIPKLKRSVTKNSSLRITGLFSHFANAEEELTTRTKNQLKRFTTLDSELDLSSRVARHIACSAAIIRYPEAHFGLVRLGIGLYGLWPSEPIQAWARANLPRFKLRPVLSWYSRLAQVKTVPAGTGVGYGSSVVAKRPMRVGVVPIGYGDGYDRRLSNNSWMVVRGRRAPVIGRVCMNLTMLDLTNIPSVTSGDRVTILGSGTSIADWSAQTGALNYELVTRLSSDLSRNII